MTWVSRTAVMSLAERGGQVKDAAGLGWVLMGCPVPDAQGPLWGQGPAEDGQTSQEVWLGSMRNVCVCVCVQARAQCGLLSVPTCLDMRSYLLGRVQEKLGVFV